MYTLILTISISMSGTAYGAAATTIQHIPLKSEVACNKAASIWLADQKQQWGTMYSAVCIANQ